MWNSGPPPTVTQPVTQPMTQPAAQPTLQQQTAAYYGQMTPEQYQQWEIYYQQYNAWYAQYGEQYAKMHGSAVAAPPQNPYPAVAMPPQTPYPASAVPPQTPYPGVAVPYPQPPLPTEKPPLPAEPPLGPTYVAAKSGPVTYQPPPPPEPQPQTQQQQHQQHQQQYQQQHQQQQQQPYQNQTSKWGHKPQVKVSQRIQYGSNRTNNNNNKDVQQNNRWNNDNSSGGFNRNSFTNGQGNNLQNRRIYQMNQPPPSYPPPPAPENKPPLPKNTKPNEPSEEEKFFDDQFKKWEEEFECWKKQNANHPDKKAYADYEKKFTDFRAKLMERREQMRRKKRAAAQCFPNETTVHIKDEPQEEIPQARESPTSATWQPQPFTNKTNEPLKPETIFPTASNSGSIPGLGFGEDEIKTEPVDTNEGNRSATSGKPQTKPLLDLSEDIQNAPQSNDLLCQLELLLENSQVSALLTLVNLTSENPNNIQMNALKPIIDALKQLTGKNEKEIIRALMEVSMKLNNHEPEPESEPEQFREPSPQEPFVRVAAAGITVIPPLEPPESQFENFPNMRNPPPLMDQPWQSFSNSRNNWDQNWSQQKQQPPPQMWNKPPPLSRGGEPGTLNNIQERLLGLSNPNLRPEKPSQDIFARRNDTPDFTDDFVEYGEINRSFGNRDGFVEYGSSTLQSDSNNFRNNTPDRNQRNARGNNMKNQRNAQNRSFPVIEESLDYGESNPTYPGKWVLISERPPLIRRTKRGKRKNRKGQIVESKKWPSKNETSQPQATTSSKAPETVKKVNNNNNGNNAKELPVPVPVAQNTPIKEAPKIPEKMPTPNKEVIVVPTYGSYPQSTTLNFHKNTVSLDEVLLEPGRLNRPPKIVILIRGPPGSGKSILARLIKDQEGIIGGTSPRILSIDDYYTIEEEKEVVDPVTGKKTMKVESKYEYELGKEEDYMQYLVRSFKKNVIDNLFNFIIVDAWNDKLHQYFEMHDIATKHGYVAYTIELLYALDVCLDHNVHGRSTTDIKNMIINWKSLPPKHILLDATNLIQFSMNEAMELAANEQKENKEASTSAEPPKDVSEIPIDTPMDSIEVDLAAEQDSEEQNDEMEETGFFKSKWEDDATENKLARLDGVSKPLRHATIEDYLQMDGWEPPRSSSNGKKRVRWADIVAKNEQTKMKQMGFVVGHTDWNKMMDPTEGSSALCDIKYIEKAPKFRRLE